MSEKKNPTIEKPLMHSVYSFSDIIIFLKLDFFSSITPKVPDFHVAISKFQTQKIGKYYQKISENSKNHKRVLKLMK